MKVETELNTSNLEPSKGLKLKFHVKLMAFVAATFSLSLFFEGWRQVHQDPSPMHWSLLLTAVFLTTLLIWLQAFWIYIEEKSKGTLKKRIAHFDRLEDFFSQRALTEPKQREPKRSVGACAVEKEGVGGTTNHTCQEHR
jgi:hypothetical protein